MAQNKLLIAFFVALVDSLSAGDNKALNVGMIFVNGMD